MDKALDNEAITVVVADDQPIIRRGLRQFLADEPDIEVIGEASTGREVIALCRELHPQVVLMDLRMPEGSGLWATKEILARETSTKILAVTTFELDEYLFAAMDLGTSGFANKDIDLDDLPDAVRVVAAGGCWLKPRLAARLAAEFSNRRPAGARPTDDRSPSILSPREQEVSALIAEGLTNQQIARRLGLETTTIKAHISSVFTKLDMNNRVQIALWAHDHNLRAATGGLG
ncbi:response regulator [Luteococcus sp.]|uniref:response regulator n=1 Tax=Luteococcus sp. TaxID=1969402 RepID=UPI0037354C81